MGISIPAGLTALIGKWLVELLLAVGEKIICWVATHEYIGGRKGAMDFLVALPEDHDNIMVIDLNRQIEWLKAKKAEKEEQGK